jgi:MFS family permease
VTATSYRALLRIPGAVAFVLPAVAGRIGIAMSGLSVVWLVRSSTGSFATAGLVVGAFGIADALIGPQAGRLIDRFGQTRVLPLAAAAHAAAVAVLLTAAVRDAPVWLLAAGGALAGATLPQLSAVAMARWSAVLDGERRAALPTAYAVESLGNSVAFLIGPALVSLIAAGGHPVPAALIAAALVVTGVLLVGAQRRTAPAVVPRSAGRRGRAGSLLRPGFAVLIGVNAAAGGYFGTMAIALTAVAVERGTPHLAAALFVLANAAGLLATLLYGLRAGRTNPHPANQAEPRVSGDADPRVSGDVVPGVGGDAVPRVGSGVQRRVGGRAEPRFHLAAAAAVVGLGSLPLLAGGSLTGVAVGVLLTAMSVPVVLVIASVLAAATVDRAVLTEALAWLGSAGAAGSAVAATAAGQAVDSVGARGGLLVAFIACAAVTTLGLVGLRGRRPHHQ